MAEPKKFDDQKILFSAVIKDGGEDCSFVMGLAGIGPDELTPVCRAGILSEVQTIIEEMTNDLRRSFAVCVIESESRKKTRKKTTGTRKTAPRSTTMPEKPGEAAQAQGDGEETEETEAIDTDAAGDEAPAAEEEREETPAPARTSGEPKKAHKTSPGQAGFFDEF